MVLVVDDAGGSGTPIVCLPMLGMTRVATAAAPALAGAPDLREVYLDLPGHGNSPGDGPADSQTILETICAWIEAHLAGPVLLAGSSYGGYLAAGHPATPGPRPRAAARVPRRAHRSSRPRPADRRAVAGRPGMARRRAGRAARPPGPGTWPPHTGCGPRGARGAVRWRPGQRALPGRPHRRPRLCPAGPGSRVHFIGPVAIVAGRDDRIVGYADQFRALRHYPHATYSVLDQAGHYLPFEQPDLLRALAQDWLRRC